MKIRGLHIFKVHQVFCNLLSVCIVVSLQKPTLLSNLWKTCKYKTIIIKVKLKPHLFAKSTEKNRVRKGIIVHNENMAGNLFF